MYGLNHVVTIPYGFKLTEEMTDWLNERVGPDNWMRGRKTIPFTRAGKDTWTTVEVIGFEDENTAVLFKMFYGIGDNEASGSIV